MRKLNDWINGHLVAYLAALIIANPLIDMLIGVGVLLTGKNIVIGIVLRGLMLVLTLQYVIFELKPHWKKHWGWLLWTILGYIGLHLLVIGSERGASLALLELKSVIKFFYLPLMTYSLVVIYLIKRRAVSMSAIAGAGVLYALFALVPIATGTAINSYSYLDKAGFNGWFYSANEIGAILAIAYPVALVYFIKENRNTKLFRILMILTIVVSSMYIGTKVPFWGVMVATLIIGGGSFIRAFVKNFEVAGLVLSCIAIAYAVNAFLPSTPIGENLGIGKPSYNVITGSQKSTDALQAEKVLSGRNVKLAQAKTNFLKASLSQKILGVGVTKGQQHEYSIEMDVFDIAFDFGIVGFLLYFSPFLMGLMLMIRYRQGISWAVSANFVAVILAIGLGFGASALAGHVMSAPAVSIYVAALVSIAVKITLEPKQLFKKIIHTYAKDALQKTSPKSLNKIIKELEKDIDSDRSRLVITANPETVMNYARDHEFRDLVNCRYSLMIPDGIGVVKACGYINRPVGCRLPGVELVQKLLELADQRHLIVSSLGAKPEVARTFKRIIKKRYPGVEVGDVIDGYGDLEANMEKIIKKQPDILLVALGVGKQEKLIYRHFDQLKGCIAIGVGGAIDVLSGNISRAPQLFINTNTEWLYRIMRQPKRFGRFYQNNIKFALIALWLKLDMPKASWWQQTNSAREN